LTPSAQQSWRDYAARIPRPGPLGSPVQLSGHQMYVRSKLAAKNANEFLQQNVFLVPDLAPSGSTLPAFVESPIVQTAIESTQLISVTFSTSEAWVNEDGAFMRIDVSPPQGPGREFFKGPFQNGLIVQGSSISPPTSPVDVASPFPFKAGQKIWLSMNIFRVDGGFGSPNIEGPIVAIS
ncbi:MAG: hypothetical protein ACE5LB_13015, partial [Acidiferrobacterales bacterium]